MYTIKLTNTRLGGHVLVNLYYMHVPQLHKTLTLTYVQEYRMFKNYQTPTVNIHV